MTTFYLLVTIALLGSLPFQTFILKLVYTTDFESSLDLDSTGVVDEERLFRRVIRPAFVALLLAFWTITAAGLLWALKLLIGL